MRIRLPAALLLAVLLSPLARPAAAAAKAGLPGAQELFRQNRWAEARDLLRSQWDTLAEKDRPAATFLIGRSYAREAEFYRALRGFGNEVGLAYLEELAKTNRNTNWIPLFTGLYLLDAGRNAEADRALLASASQIALPPPWRATARLRRGVALHRLGRGGEAAGPKDLTAEGRFCALLATGAAEPPPTPPKDARERLLTAVLLFRASRAAEAETLLAAVSLDSPDVEDKADPKKLLRFHDPAVGTAWERVCWERSVVSLRPLAVGGAGIERALAAYYVGLGLFRLGADAESSRFLKEVADSTPSPELGPSAALLLASVSWKAHPPAATELAPLWESTQSQPDAVLLWDELRAPELAKAEPFATKLDARLRDLLQTSSDRPGGALVGRWGLARLGRGDDPAALGAVLSEHRDKSNKNKLEWNDPLLLLALSAASCRDREYAQALETLFELSKTLPGLRPLQWNLQGIYAARQKAGGEARISQ